MKKIILLIFILNAFVSLHSQITRVDYYFWTKNTVDTVNVRSFLLFNKKESLYIFNSIFESHVDEVSKTATGEMQFTTTVNDTIGVRVQNIFASDSLRVIDKVVFEHYEYNDTKKIVWKIFKEFKTIGGYKCNKAQTYFRGRNYTAWFTEQIPISAGPWKFGGLPGLILEVFDDQNDVTFKLLSIKPYQSKKIINFDSVGKFEKMSFKAFIGLQDNYGKKSQKYTASQLPRGATMTVLSTSHRIGLETKFEWESDYNK